MDTDASSTDGARLIADAGVAKERVIIGIVIMAAYGFLMETFLVCAFDIG